MVSHSTQLLTLLELYQMYAAKPQKFEKLPSFEFCFKLESHCVFMKRFAKRLMNNTHQVLSMSRLSTE